MHAHPTARLAAAALLRGLAAPLPACSEDRVGVARAEAGYVRMHTIGLGRDMSHQPAATAPVTGGTCTRAFEDTTFTAAASESSPYRVARLRSGRRRGNVDRDMIFRVER